MEENDSNTPNAPVVGQPLEPVIVPVKGKRGFNPQVFLFALIAVAIGLAVYMAWRQPEGLFWLFLQKPKLNPPAPSDVGTALGPILALALMIERVLETIFDIFERNWEQVAHFGTATSEGAAQVNNLLDLYNRQLENAMSDLARAVTIQRTEDDSFTNDLRKRVRDAELHVREASNKLAAMTKDPKYLAWKRTITIWLGLILGLIVAIISDEGVFEHLNMSVPRILDMLVTGFVIGAGSGPMHSLIGILQSAKSTLENLGNMTNVTTLQKDIEELKSAALKTEAAQRNEV